MAQQQREADNAEYLPISNSKEVSLPRNLLDMGKKEIIAGAKDIYNAMMDGIIDPIETQILIKKGLAFFEALDENVRPVIYGKNIVARGDVFKTHNVEIEPAELGVKWLYDRCESPELERLQEDVKKATEALKAHQVALQCITTATVMVDTDTGEEYTAHPAVRTCTSGYKFSIKN